MRLLLDSHLLVWLLYEPDRISAHVASEIQAAENVSLSTVSLWELTFKHLKGKLAYPPMELAAGRAALHLNELPVLSEHILALPDVELPHADPFDRLLVAQARAERSVLVTADSNILASNQETLSARQAHNDAAGLTEGNNR